jgi:hypothetical protein
MNTPFDQAVVTAMQLFERRTLDNVCDTAVRIRGDTLQFTEVVKRRD